MKKVLAICCAALLCLPAGAQSLDECHSLAREHYPEIRQYGLVEQTEAYDLANAARAWLPQVTVSGQATWQSAAAAYPEALRRVMAAQGMEVEGLQKEQYKVAVDVAQTIWDGGSTKARKAVTKAEAEEQRRSADVNLYALEERVENIYFGILLLEERKVQAEAAIRLLESNLARLRSYYKNGVAMQSDVSAVEAEVLTAGQNLEQIETARASYRRMLEIFIGRPLSDRRLQRPAMPKVENAVGPRPELGLFEARRHKLAARREALDASVMPRFSAFAQGYYGYPGLDMFKSMTSNNPSLNAILGVRMSWNISAFYTKKNSLRKLQTATEAVALQRDVFLFNTRLQSAQQEGEIERLRKAVATDGRIVELRREVRMAAESQLENGIIDVADLLRKITDETTARQRRNEHETELLQAVYRLKHTLNQ